MWLKPVSWQVSFTLGMNFFVIQLCQQAEGVAVPRPGPQKVKGREEERRKGDNRKRRLSSETTLLSITKYFPVEENTWPWLSMKSYYLPIIENVLVIHAWTSLLSEVKGMAGRGRMEIGKLFGSTFLQLIYGAFTHLLTRVLDSSFVNFITLPKEIY